MKTYQVVVWSSRIKPEDRNSRNLSDGASFRDPKIATKYMMQVLLSGGAIASVRECENGTGWYESLAELHQVGSMSLTELEVIKRRGTLGGIIK